jgi:hypothetical protein
MDRVTDRGGKHTNQQQAGTGVEVLVIEFII